MRNNILLTGMPKSGKSTMLERIISEQNNKMGLITKEVREDGERTGFEMFTHNEQSAILASIYFDSEIQVSKYGVKILSLDKIIPFVSEINSKDILYLDEIGRMQMHSESFKELATQYLDSENTTLATITMNYSDDFIKSVKERNDIILVEISPENRESKYEFVSKLIGKIAKATRYSNEPERFTISDKFVSIKTDHGEKHLSKENNIWSCDCPFYAQNNLCSHLLAYENLISKEKK